MFYQSLSNVICSWTLSFISFIWSLYIKSMRGNIFGANAVGKQNERESNEIL